MYDYMVENMHNAESWLLPDGIKEVLPGEARRLEELRRQLIDMFATWGYELVIPPFVDFLDSLLTGSGSDLDLQTFKLTDQMSGKMLGVRADMTPLVARIDAHNLKYEHPARLCYVGTILRTLTDTLEKSRSPMQIGAEIYGHSGLESDLEIIRLMLEMLSIAGVKNVHLDLGHVGIYRGLVEQAGLEKSEEAGLFDILQRKARPELEEFLSALSVNETYQSIIRLLPSLNGGRAVLSEARQHFSGAGESVLLALDELESMADKLKAEFSALEISFDLSELRGYNYHTGLVFACFVPGLGKEIARGGRYDNIGACFGRERAATGFSADLRLLAMLMVEESVKESSKVYAPCIEDMSLSEAVRDLRAQGIPVIQQLPGHNDEFDQLSCTAILEKGVNGWVVKPLK